MKRKLTAVALLALTACGGGSGGTQATPQAEAVSPAINIGGQWKASYFSNIESGTLYLDLNTPIGNTVSGLYTSVGTGSTTGHGFVDGTISGTTYTFTLTLPVTGCAGNLHGTAQFDPNTLATFSLNYAGNISCRGQETGSGTGAYDVPAGIIPGKGKLVVVYTAGMSPSWAYSLLEKNSVGTYTPVASISSFPFTYYPPDTLVHSYKLVKHAPEGYNVVQTVLFSLDRAALSN